MLKPGQSVKDYDAETASKNAEAAKNKDKVVPNRGAFDTLSKIQQDASAKRAENQKAAKADTSSMSKWERRRAARRSSSASAVKNTNSGGQAVKVDKAPVSKTPVTKEPVTKEPVTKEPVTKAPVNKAPVQSSQDAKTNAAYDKMRKSDPTKAAAQGKAVAKAKFGDQLKPKTANPLMKALKSSGVGKTVSNAVKSSGAGKAIAPAVKTVKDAMPKAAPSSGAQAAMKAAPMSRIAKATSNIKPMKEEFDLILEHLMEQGFPQEEALKLMVNMSEEKREQILEMRHRDAKTGEVTDKPEIGKTYYTDGPRQKSSVALRKEKEAAKKKTQKEEIESIEENRRAARAAKGGYKDDSKKQTDPSKDGFTGISNSIADIMKQNKEIEAANKKKKTQKEEAGSLLDAYRSMYVSEKKELSVDDQMRISQEHNRKSAEEKKEANKKAMGHTEKVAPKKDERTDAEKMADATGPRKGSNYRGD